MVQYIITPWLSQAELLLVRQQLYPSPEDVSNLDVAGRKSHAVAKVSVWMQRGNCPHLVESTAILTSAILNDVPGNSTYCVRAAYSAAFCRFVTGLLDSHQDKKHKLSMYSIAKTIGLPATYVELRHQATHEELPSLSKLRTATQKALRWIWDYYWTHLPPATAPATAEPSSPTDKLNSLLQSYFAAEEDEETRERLEAELEKWDQDELLEGILKVQSTTDDTTVLLSATRLQRRLMASESDVESNRSLGTNLDRVKAELDRMEGLLTDSEDDSNPPSDISDVGDEIPVDKSVVRGWTMWEGPWVPKPIGVV